MEKVIIKLKGNGKNLDYVELSISSQSRFGGFEAALERIEAEIGSTVSRAPVLVVEIASAVDGHLVLFEKAQNAV